MSAESDRGSESGNDVYREGTHPFQRYKARHQWLASQEPLHTGDRIQKTHEAAEHQVAVEERLSPHLPLCRQLLLFLQPGKHKLSNVRNLLT